MTVQIIRTKINSFKAYNLLKIRLKHLVGGWHIMCVQQFSRCHKYEIDKIAWTAVLCNRAFPSLGSDFSRLLLI